MYRPPFTYEEFNELHAPSLLPPLANRLCRATTNPEWIWMKYVLRRHSSSTGLDGQRFRSLIYIYIPSPIVATILYSLLVAVDRLEKDLFLQWRPQASSPRQAATIRLRLWRDAQSVVVGYRLIRLADIAFDSPVSIDRSLPEEIMHPRERNVSLFSSSFSFYLFCVTCPSQEWSRRYTVRKFLVSNGLVNRCQVFFFL